MMKTKKLLLAVIAISILSLSVLFSGCAKTQPQGAVGFLVSKIHHWNAINKKNPKELDKYKKICYQKINSISFGNYARTHFNQLQIHNIQGNCYDLMHEFEKVGGSLPLANTNLYGK
ncbi:MAG: hypothetical protein ACYCT7_01750 [bacterium]